MAESGLLSGKLICDEKPLVTLASRFGIGEQTEVYALIITLCFRVGF